MTKIGSVLVMLVAMLGGAGEVWAKPMKAILRSGFLALAIMALAVPAIAGPFEDGFTAYQRGDFLGDGKQGFVTTRTEAYLTEKIQSVSGCDAATFSRRIREAMRSHA